MVANVKSHKTIKIKYATYNKYLLYKCINILH